MNLKPPAAQPHYGWNMHRNSTAHASRYSIIKSHLYPKFAYT